MFRLNPTKCKEMQIDFRKNRGTSIPLESEGKQFEVVKSAKILGLTVRDDLKWNDHIDNVTVKASQRVYLQILTVYLCFNFIVLAQDQF